MINNKIKIPWYRKNVKIGTYEEPAIQPTNFSIPNLPKSKPSGEPKPQVEPEPEPVREPSRVPSKVPVLEPDPFPFPDKFPLPFPIPPFKENPFPFPFPLPKPNGKGLGNPKPSPQPAFIEPAPTMFEKVAGTILKPVIYFFAAKQVSNQIIKANVTDPVYGKMLNDPVLGYALREAEKSNLDMQQVANYFANYDYDNFSAEQMTKELTVMFGAATAARLVIFFIGRKVVLKF